MMDLMDKNRFELVMAEFQFQLRNFLNKIEFRCNKDKD